MIRRGVGNSLLTLACLILPAGVPGLCCRKAPPPAARPSIITTKTGVEMVLLPGGWFEMGSSDGKADERPVRRVWVDAFLIDRCEVTQEQLRRLQIPDPSHFKGPRRPVEQVTFPNAVEFCNERSAAEGLRPCYTLDRSAGRWTCDYAANGYRLPTEAEWEYACRAGTAAARFFAPDTARALGRYAWYAANSSRRTHPAGRKQPNPWGLYDLYGNVAEWCSDAYDPNYYRASPARNPRGPTRAKRTVLRGGAWDSPPGRCRSADRAGEDPRFHDACFARDTIGFRCVRRAPRPATQAAERPDRPS
jgi:sulfatase modifying factor 1